MEENEELKEAVEKLDSLSEDERMQRIAELRDKAIRDEKAVYATGLEVGMKQGIKQGMKEGMKEGEQRGLERGKKESKREMAKSMLKEKLSIDIIIRVTGLTKEEIEKL